MIKTYLFAILLFLPALLAAQQKCNFENELTKLPTSEILNIPSEATKIYKNLDLCECQKKCNALKCNYVQYDSISCVIYNILTPDTNMVESYNLIFKVHPNVTFHSDLIDNAKEGPKVLKNHTLSSCLEKCQNTADDTDCDFILFKNNTCTLQKFEKVSNKLGSNIYLSSTTNIQNIDLIPPSKPSPTQESDGFSAPSKNNDINIFNILLPILIIILTIILLTLALGFCLKKRKRERSLTLERNDMHKQNLAPRVTRNNTFIVKNNNDTKVPADEQDIDNFMNKTINSTNEINSIENENNPTLRSQQPLDGFFSTMYLPGMTGTIRTFRKSKTSSSLGRSKNSFSLPRSKRSADTGQLSSSDSSPQKYNTYPPRPVMDRRRSSESSGKLNDTDVHADVLLEYKNMSRSPNNQLKLVHYSESDSNEDHQEKNEKLEKDFENATKYVAIDANFNKTTYFRGSRTSGYFYPNRQSIASTLNRNSSVIAIADSASFEKVNDTSKETKEDSGDPNKDNLSISSKVEFK
ncbi:hypothetical protein HDU92_006779 [Lobulomyces angularis]|nr:hypothetical protein HDU92_006779 [Lobulomyces angularis]